MNTTDHIHSNTVRLTSPSGACRRGAREFRPPPRTTERRSVSTLGGLALLALLGVLSHSAQAVTCGAAQRGTLGANNTFTQGTTGSHNDYRIRCTGDTSGQGVSVEDLTAAFNHADADDVANENGRLVIQLTNAYLRIDKDEFPVGDDLKGGIVVLGTEGGASGWNEGIDIDIDELGGDLKVESHATISATGGARGIDVWIADDSHYFGRVEVHNFGSVTTTGGGATDAGRRGYAVVAASRGGVVEVVNEEGATIAASGPGGRGIVAGTVGSTATATNRGTITTRGNAYQTRRANGIAAFSHWDNTAKSGGVARATNETTGTVTTYGLGAEAIVAYSGSRGNYGTAAVATNKGTVTTHGIISLPQDRKSVV